MRTETDIRRYQKTLVNFRKMAKATIANAPTGSTEFTEAIKVFLRCDAAIQITNWILEVDDTMDFGPPPTITQREIGK